VLILAALTEDRVESYPCRLDLHEEKILGQSASPVATPGQQLLLVQSTSMQVHRARQQAPQSTLVLAALARLVILVVL
jgi:hypothetical protein